MKFESKRNLQNVVFIVINGKILEEKIRRIDIKTTADGNYSVHYQLSQLSGGYGENSVYSTKEEAGIAILEANGLSIGVKGLE